MNLSHPYLSHDKVSEITASTKNKQLKCKQTFTWLDTATFSVKVEQSIFVMEQKSEQGGLGINMLCGQYGSMLLLIQICILLHKILRRQQLKIK